MEQKKYICCMRATNGYQLVVLSLWAYLQTLTL